MNLSFIKSICIFILVLATNCVLISQCNTSLSWEYGYNGNVSPFSIEVDKLDRPFLYVASNEDGLIILSTDGELVSQIGVDQLSGDVKNLEQVGTKLYLATGAHTAGTSAGLDIIDISSPQFPSVLGSWIDNHQNGNGSGVIRIQEDYAYLGAMGLGLVILNISDPSAIEESGRINFDINFPFPDPTPSFYNSRGLFLVDDLAYVCHDAGGLHIVDVSDKSFPLELGQFANPVTYPNGMNWPRAYNNVIVNDDLAYIAVDYCGLEVVDISDPSDIKLINHHNPHNCPTGVWWNAPVHTNELVFNEACKKLFVTTGKSELKIYDIANPLEITECGEYGSIADTTATWGLDMRRDSIFLAYITIPIYIPFIHPFDAKWPGVKMLTWSDPCVEFSNTHNVPDYLDLLVFPNPSEGWFCIESSDIIDEVGIIDLQGQWQATIKNKPSQEYCMEHVLGKGVYILKIRSGQNQEIRKLIIH